MISGMDEQSNPGQSAEESKTHISSGNQAVFVAVGMQLGVGHWYIPQQEVEQNITVADLPSADPHVKGQLWSNAGAITISVG